MRRVIPVAALLCLSIQLAACGGADPAIASTPETVIVIPPPPAAAPPVVDTPVPPTGTLKVAVVDPENRPLPDAHVVLRRLGGSATTSMNGPVLTDAGGVASFSGPSGPFRLSVDHPLGHFFSSYEGIPATGSLEVTAFVKPVSPVTVAVLPARIPVDGISADRTSLELHITLVAASASGFVPSSYGVHEGGQPSTPMVILENCYVWLDPGERTPGCKYDSEGRVSVLEYTYEVAANPETRMSPAGGSVMLMMEQGDRAAAYDPHSLRFLAARHFLREIRARQQTSGSIRSAVAGFAGQGASGAWPSLLLPAPLWDPGNPAGAFLASASDTLVAVDQIGNSGSGSPPVFEALRSGFDLLAAHTPADSRVIVALVGGGDGGGWTPEQVSGHLADLERRATVAAVRTLLVAGTMDEHSADREQLARLGYTIQAPVIHAGVPANWTAAPYDGLYAAMELAAELVTDAPLPRISLVFRLETDAGTPFRSGSELVGTLGVESDQCPMGCAVLPLAFVARIP